MPQTPATPQKAPYAIDGKRCAAPLLPLVI